jgi:hypothetical protein
MRHPYRVAFLVFGTIGLLTGCSTVQRFNVLVTVLNKADGTPVSGAKVILDDLGVEERKLDHDYGGWPEDDKTDANGQTAWDDFLVSPYPSYHPHWYLKVSKEGFEPVVIDIKPSPQPPRTNATIPLNVTVKMRPKAAPPR